ncbi:hypothetical protein HPP92_003432 [Vanilla planifolia]|uniref:Ubiquinol oxidase n=1 Tax=Vanilla planifolia TaxID=51239 RepID=A0A835RUV9_VANPL|nr:hypothetical protein HPP92_003432 [Vanilla planifolia]
MTGRVVSSDQIGSSSSISRAFHVRLSSTAATPSTPSVVGRENEDPAKRDASAAPNPPNSNQLTSYWGAAPRKLFKEDGTEWRWSCFRPWDTYHSDTSIDLKKHHAPTTFLDKIAYWTVKTLRVPTDIFFQRRYGCRAMMLETVAAVPGMVGGMLPPTLAASL